MRPLLQVVIPNPLPYKPYGRNQAITTAEIPVDAILYNGHRIRLALIEEGFVFDGVSRPGLFAWWIKRWGPQVAEAAFHDWLLELMARGVIGPPKFLVDLAMLLVLVARGHSFARASGMFLAVRTRRRPGLRAAKEGPAAPSGTQQ